MRSTFEVSLAETLRHEGGFSRDPRDPGNWTGGKRGRGILKGTKKGISAAAYPGEDIENLTDERIALLYRRDYWQPVQGDALPPGLDFTGFDAGVNSGVRRGAQWLQRGLGVKADGVVGPATLAAAKAANSVTAIKAACAARLGFLRGLKALWPTYGRGWTRRVAEVEAFAVALAVGGSVLRKTAVTAQANEADRTAARDTAKAAGAGGGGAVTTHIPDLPDWATIGAGIVIVVLVLFFVGNRIVSKQRAAAYRAQAERMDHEP